MQARLITEVTLKQRTVVVAGRTNRQPLGRMLAHDDVGGGPCQHVAHRLHDPFGVVLEDGVQAERRGIPGRIQCDQHGAVVPGVPAAGAGDLGRKRIHTLAALGHFLMCRLVREGMLGRCAVCLEPAKCIRDVLQVACHSQRREHGHFIATGIEAADAHAMGAGMRHPQARGAEHAAGNQQHIMPTA